MTAADASPHAPAAEDAARAAEAAMVAARSRRNARIGHDCEADGVAFCPACVSYRAGWQDAMDTAPPLPWLLQTWSPPVADAYRTGRRARLAYERRRTEGGAS